MKVEIEHKTRKQGWLDPVLFYEVRVFATFTAQELAIIKTANLYGFKVADRSSHPASEIPDLPEPLTLQELIDHHPEGYAFASMPAAKDYENRVLMGLQRIKQLIEANIDPVTRRTEYL